jgi:hypothetical protein
MSWMLPIDIIGVNDCKRNEFISLRRVTHQSTVYATITRTATCSTTTTTTTQTIPTTQTHYYIKHRPAMKSQVYSRDNNRRHQTSNQNNQQNPGGSDRKRSRTRRRKKAAWRTTTKTTIHPHIHKIGKNVCSRTGRIFVLQYFAKLSIVRSCFNLSSRSVLSPLMELYIANLTILSGFVWYLGYLFISALSSCIFCIAPGDKPVPFL